MKPIKDVTVLIADGVPDSQGDVFSPETEITLPNGWVSVRDDFSPEKSVGRAMLRREGNRIVADLEINEKFLVDGKVPCIGGHYLERLPGGIIVQIEVNHLVLCEENADPRVPPIKEKRQ